MKYTKQYCRDLAQQHGYSFVCWEREDNTYHFTKGDNHIGFIDIRLNEWYLDEPEKWSLGTMFDKGYSSLYTLKNLQSEYRTLKADVKWCEDNEHIFVNGDYYALAELSKMIQNTIKYK